VVSGSQRTLERIGKAEFRKITDGQLGFLLCLAARASLWTRIGPGVLPASGRGRNGQFLVYCSREMAPPVGGASRNRETTYGG
jgi:hypothetical protein